MTSLAAPATAQAEDQPTHAGFPWLIVFITTLWTWVCWSCAEHWRGDPNYSYGWIVPPLAIAFAARRAWLSRDADGGEMLGRWRISGPTAASFGVAAGAIVFAFEFARVEMWHPEIVLWALCLSAVICTLNVLFWFGGKTVAKAGMFPALFFLTAVAWPPRVEQPITSFLMHRVAETTVELLHWLGVQAQTSGAAIALNAGLVGITEACSGTRSLQAGIMFGLAIGEWFLLRPARRALLLAIAIVLALLSNVTRTVALSLQAESHGISVVEGVHDLIGNVVVGTLVLGIWLSGKLLQTRKDATVTPLRAYLDWARSLWRRISAPAAGTIGVIVTLMFSGFVGARLLSARFDWQQGVQTAPFFSAQVDGTTGTQLIPVPRDIWNELRPTSGEYIRRASSNIPRGVADLFHFFWKPSPWNRYALVHRPDICMPGIGWEMSVSPEPITIDFNGFAVRCYAFQFHRGNDHAIELWGVWRNGSPVPLDYQPAQVFGSALPPPGLQLEGKRGSATEIVACSITASDAAPAKEIAVALMRSIFQYKRR
ncbi:MAG: exosortase/archaeosortase family protein [Chthoniobacterales bacterium]